MSKSALTQFSTGGHTVYHLRPATVDNSGKRAIISAAFDGTVLCHYMDGTPLWKSPTAGFFIFDLAVGDIDGDGFDEAFAASADGTLYAFDHDGTPLWTFSQTAPMLCACVIRKPDGRAYVMAGGIEQCIYSIIPQGNLAGSTRTRGIVHLITAGCYLTPGDPVGAAVICDSCRSREQMMHINLFSAEDARPIWEEDMEATFDIRHTHEHDFAFQTQFQGTIAVLHHPHTYGMVAADINHDGVDEMLMGHGYEDFGNAFIYTGKQEKLPWNFKSPVKIDWIYAMNLLSHVRIDRTGEEYILDLFGQHLFIHDLDGTCTEKLLCPFSLADGVFDYQTNTYCLGSSISGGDSVYLLDLTNPDWKKEFETIPAEGKIQQLIFNMDQLKEQVRSFPREEYKYSIRPFFIVNLSPEQINVIKQEWDLHNIDLASYHTKTEAIPADWIRDKRMAFDLSRDEIVRFAENMERNGDHFAMWGGHGGSFYMMLGTFEAVLKAAPNTVKAFVFAEMWPSHPSTKALLEEKMKPLAELCLKYGKKKIILRNQRLFWVGACYKDDWQELIFNPRYREIFVPSMEETHCRTQDMSLAGRVGLWFSGMFAHHSGRAVRDNATFCRLWEWSSQELAHTHLRKMIYHASLGAELFLVNLTDDLFPQFCLFFQMIDKGIVKIPRREELLSVSEVAIGMRSPAEAYYAQAENAHKPIDYQPELPEMVFDRLDWKWSGAPLRENDLSGYAFGCKTRMLNYMPRFPYGFVPIIPDSMELAEIPRFKKKFSTDGEVWYDEFNKPRTPADFRPIVESALREGAHNLPVRVEGDVAWSVVRVHDHCIRITLVDSGYTDPDDRGAVIYLQHVQPVRALDILSRNHIACEDNQMRVNVPMGSVKIIDIEVE